MTTLGALKSHLKRGEVYRRSDLTRLSRSVDRHVHELVTEGTLTKVAPGIYYYPKKTAFGDAPADDETLVRQFLKDDRFLLTSPNVYNTLGIGTTQLYNKRVVYNHKRHGEFILGNRRFDFKVKPHFPKKLTEDFLVVDLVNNLDNLAEESVFVLARLKEKVKSMDTRKLKRHVTEYGNLKAKKLLLPLLEEPEPNADAR